ncbi:MAG: sugar transferase [Rhodospirillaceae bacterium]|nr:sugar transferase [Rhodospirillaceae bacterium]
MTSPRLHIGLIDPWVQQPGDAAINRSRTLAQAFAQSGHRVTLLAGARGAESAPTQSLVPTLTILECLPPLVRKFGFPVSIAGRFGRSLRLYFALCAQPSLDIIILRSTPAAHVWPCAIYSFFSGVPLIIDAPDTLPSTSDRLGFFSAWMVRRSTKHVFCAAPEIKTRFESMGFSSGRVSIAANGCDTALFGARRDAASLIAKHPHLGKGPLVVYAGQLHRGRRVSDILDLAAVMRGLATDIRFAIAGDGPDRLELNAYAARLDVLERNVWFLPLLPREELADLLSIATAVIALPAPGADGLDAGTHIFDGLAAGKPIAVIGEGWQKDLIEGRQAGVILPTGQAEAAARELLDFLRAGDLVHRAGEQASALARGKYNAARIVTDMRQTIEKLAAAYSRSAVLRRRSLAVKRGLDIVFSLAGLVVLSPIMVVIALVMVLAGWPPLAGRARSGRRGKAFNLFAFDTLPTDRRQSPQAPANWGDRWARFLRRTALDRLPELINVLKGDMSLVGPRALPAEYSTYYNDEQRRRLDLRPGITGWAQIKGRSGFTWDEMFAHDIWYVDHVGVGLDLKILAQTLFGVLAGRGMAGLPTGQLARFDEIEARRQGAEDV